jgi:NAD(P)-dependent dehydrogenase (short-subunit alcohol dehydrogenase family)
MIKTRQLKGKIGFVTGGGTGLGCARRMVDEGAQVVIAGRREAAHSLGAAASWVVCDVADEAAVQRAVDTVLTRHGRFDLAVNSAGAGCGSNVLQRDAAGVDMLTRCQADDLGPGGIRVNAVLPCLVQTDIVDAVMRAEAVVGAYLDCMPIRRVGQPADVAAMVALLLSDEAGWITGQCIAVDGGHTARGTPHLALLFGTDIPSPSPSH